MTSMTPERWQRMKGVLYEALELPTEQRAEFLDRVCSGEDSLRREVDSMLSSGDQSCSNLLQSSRPRVPLSSGTKLGHYEVQSLLGAGGMGEVYRGHDPRLGRDVAVKVLPHLFSEDPERLRRFEQEGRAAAALNHPNILAIYDVGTTEEGIPYVVSELLEGETLRQCLRKGPLTVRKTVDLSLQMAKGLAAAHDRGIIHRDLKPENLFLTKNGHLKILDFGLAKLVDSQAASPNARTLTRDTTAGAMMGTVGYMPPEQVRGLAIDQRSDIFAMGAVVYEMLSGKRAFQGETTADTIDAILNRDPRPLTETNPAVPPSFERVVQRCLEKNPDERFHSVRDVAFAIEALTDLPSASQHAALIGDSRWLRWAKWVGVLALVLAAVLIGLYLRRSSLASRSGTSSPSLEVRALTESGKASRVAATPDGRYVAYVNRDGGKYELRLLQVATERDVQVLPGQPLSIRSLHFSPDGNFIYFLRQLDPSIAGDLGVFRIATLGGPATPLATDARSPDARFNSVTVSPDGKQIAYIAQTQSESQIVAIDPDGANRHVLAKRPVALGFWCVEWSPLLNSLAAAVIVGKDGMGLVTVELPAGSIRELSVSGWGAVGQPAWSPDGATIFAPAVPTAGSVMQIWAVDAHTGARWPVTSGSTYYLQPTLSATATGDLIANTVTPALTLWATDRSARLRPITAFRDEGSESVIWVDGRIVTSNITEMIVHDPDGRNATKLRSYSDIYRQLARCGPGHVVYWAFDGQHQAHIARTDIITGSTSRLTDGPLDDRPSCTSDGSTLVFNHCEDQGNHCFVTRRSIDSGQSLALLELGRDDESQSLAISPEGTKIFLRRNDAADPYRWATIIPTAGGNPQRLRMPIPASDLSAFTWAPDGKSILYAQKEHGVGNIWSVPIDGKAPRKLTTFDSGEIFSFGVSPDNRLAISRGAWATDVVLIKNAK